MAEEHIFIESGELKIEGLLDDLPGDRGVVVTHPHPLYGGEMRNNVVETIAQAYREEGYSTLRINFRGVGRSQGKHDNGIGEQEDVRAALTYLSDLNKVNIDLAGYSFGAWVNALGLESFEHVNRMVMVSPPVNFIDFSFLKSNSTIKLVIVGTNDDIAGAKAVEELLPAWNPEAVFRTIRGADHFYWGMEDKMKAIIKNFLSE
ncbi:MAG: alpha/beta hydrolase [Thermodesulfobacteriota bacterium]|nr:alpha/beta hydrolase [Thermodesulfobacteriota bacterium]